MPYPGEPLGGIGGGQTELNTGRRFSALFFPSLLASNLKGPNVGYDSSRFLPLNGAQTMREKLQRSMIMTISKSSRVFVLMKLKGSAERFQSDRWTATRVEG
jgi:hypothetical protein